MQLTRAFLGLSVAATITVALPVYQCGEAICSNAEEQYSRLEGAPMLMWHDPHGSLGNYRTELEPIPGYTRNKQEEVARVVGGRSGPEYYDFGKDPLNALMLTSASPSGNPRLLPFGKNDHVNPRDHVKPHAGPNAVAGRTEADLPLHSLLGSNSKTKAPGAVSVFQDNHGRLDSRDEKAKKGGPQETLSTPLQLDDGREKSWTDSPLDPLAGERFYKPPSWYHINLDNVQKRDYYTTARPFDFSKPQGSLYDEREDGLHMEPPLSEGDFLARYQKRHDQAQQKQEQQQQQPVQPASHLLDCLAAAMGDMHQNLLCINSHFGRLEY